MMTGARVDDLFDEVFDDPDSVHAASHGGIPDPLLAELERSRSGSMRDIVATIQAEQDVVIRAPLDACLIVQGGPGTGKTAVGLHRAAFLLYEHRLLLGDRGVLVLGPEPGVPPLHRAGAAVARRDVRDPDDDGATGRRPDPGVRRPGRGPAEGRRPLGNGAGARARPDRFGPADDLVISTEWGQITLPATSARSDRRDPRPRCSVRHRPAGAANAAGTHGVPAVHRPSRRGRGRAERLRYRPSHQRRLPSRARAHLADDQWPGAGQATLVESRGPQPCRRRSTRCRRAATVSCAPAVGSWTTNLGQRRSSSSSTRPKHWSTASHGSMATSWSTRRRTSRRWRCERSPAVARVDR